jgi:hypothetical protein
MIEPKTFEEARIMLALTVRGIANMLVEAGKVNAKLLRMGFDNPIGIGPQDAVLQAVERVGCELPAILCEEQRRFELLAEQGEQSKRWSEDLLKIAKGEEKEKKKFDR